MVATIAASATYPSEVRARVQPLLTNKAASAAVAMKLCLRVIMRHTPISCGAAKGRGHAISLAIAIALLSAKFNMRLTANCSTGQALQEHPNAPMAAKLAIG